jgi:HNH endonuclease
MDAATRRLVRDRAGNRCEYCRIHQDDEPFFRLHVEHIVARQHHGSNDSDNLALSCHHDNDHKGPNLSGIDPQTGRVVRLFNPRRQRWARHFRFDGPVIVGRTSCGRATVVVLALNAPDRVELRAELIAAGTFPPPS